MQSELMYIYIYIYICYIYAVRAAQRIVDAEENARSQVTKRTSVLAVRDIHNCMCVCVCVYLKLLQGTLPLSSYALLASHRKS